MYKHSVSASPFQDGAAPSCPFDALKCAILPLPRPHAAIRPLVIIDCLFINLKLMLNIQHVTEGLRRHNKQHNTQLLNSAKRVGRWSR